MILCRSRSEIGGARHKDEQFRCHLWCSDRRSRFFLRRSLHKLSLQAAPRHRPIGCGREGLSLNVTFGGIRARITLLVGA